MLDINLTMTWLLEVYRRTCISLRYFSATLYEIKTRSLCLSLIINSINMTHSHRHIQLCDCRCVLPDFNVCINFLIRAKYQQMYKLQNDANEENGRSALCGLCSHLPESKLLSAITVSEMGILCVQAPHVTRMMWNVLVNPPKRSLISVYALKEKRYPIKLHKESVRSICTLSTCDGENRMSMFPVHGRETEFMDSNAFSYSFQVNDIVEVEFNASWYPGMIMECNLDDGYSVLWWMDDNSQRFGRQVVKSQLRIPLSTLQCPWSSISFLGHAWQFALDWAKYILRKHSLIVKTR